MKRIIYAYDTPTYRKNGWLKVGDTERDALTRISEQITASNPEQLILRGEWEIDHKYRDYEIHKILETKLGIERIYKPADNVGVEEEDDGSIPFLKGKKGTEWFRCSTKDVETAINILNFGIARPDSFPMREEQEDFVNKAFNYFTNGGREFLGNAKCRFGKTFATYCLMKKLGAKITLVLTYKPAVGGEWSSNLNSHIYFENYKFYHALDFDKNNPIKINGENVVLFASFQDILGTDFDGGIKMKWKDVTDFLNKYGIDLLVIDEAHFGADKKRAMEFTSILKYRYRLDLSGTPLDLLMRGDYTDENTYTWSYIDEQKKRRKEMAEGKMEVYKWLPELHLYTYELGDEIIKDSDAYTEEEGLRLNKFFSSDDGEAFKNSSAVERWLNLLAAEDERFWCSPFNNNDLAGKLNHIFWILPDVNSCKAMRRTLGKHPYFRLFRVITASDDNDGEGRNTVELVRSSIRDNQKTITLSCGKLNTGVTIKQWTAVFQLSDTASPETYWQTNFRPQSECKEMGKLDCSVFDFNPNRTLKMIYRYCEITARKNKSTPESIREFLETIKVLSYSGNKLVPMSNDALEKIIESVIDIAEESKKFESVRMISVDKADDEVLNALVEILETGGDTTNTDIANSDLKGGKTFINHGGKKKGKKDDPERKLIEKGITILKSLPTFVFIADKQYESLTDVMDTDEMDLFKTATSLSLEEFKYMVNCGFFVGERLDRAVQALHLIQNRE